MSEERISTGYITLARVLRPRGNRGEVAAADCSDDPRRFASPTRVYLCDPDGQRREVVLERAWTHRDRLILKFGGVDSISEAKALSGCRVQIPESEVGPPPEGGCYLDDLLGCKVIDADTGRTVGEVENILEPGEVLLMQVRSGKREILIPFASSICVKVMPDKKEIRVRMPEGLEALNP